MSKTTLQHETLETLARVDLLYSYFLANGNGITAEKAKELAKKLQENEYAIAFCGHFSAGKSTMINTIIGESILPSSPIPTSANLVKIKQGEDYAKVYFKEGKPLLYRAPYDYNMVKSYCKNGDEIRSIELSKQSTKLPKGIALLDTPGIDSTDDAHRIATESALHLADLVFYCMDYNHVQSEVNFMFTKELTEEGKEVYLIVNQIDKHRNDELSFSDFKQSVVDSFSSWGVRPERIFYTSLKEPNHPNNEYESLKSFLDEVIEIKAKFVAQSVTNTMLKLIKEHLSFELQRDKEAMDKYEAVISSLDNKEQVALPNRLADLEAELQVFLSSVHENERKLKDVIEDILKNAYLMPFQTRELAKGYLEARQPDFKVGLFFAKKKTEQEQQARLSTFFSDLESRVKSQLEWHLKEALNTIFSEFSIDDAELSVMTQGLNIPLSAQLLVEVEKKDARFSGEYVLNYTSELVESIKKLARNELQPIINRYSELLNRNATSKLEGLHSDLKRIQIFMDAFEQKKKLHEKHIKSQDELEQYLFGEMKVQKDMVEIVTQLGIQEEEFDLVTTPNKPDEMIISEKEVKEDHVPTLDSFTHVLQVEEVVKRLNSASKLLREVPGFKTVTEELSLKAERLNQRGFTIALFGAFSAGKSSFANALIGQKLLPVSPNPTTATINKIMPVTSENQHGLVKVHFKSSNGLLEEIQRSLHYFEQKATTLEEAIRVIEQMNSTFPLVDAGEKVHFSFLTAFLKGYKEVIGKLGETLYTDLEEFSDYVAKEEKSCFVESIEVYYDCELTRHGITLVDTPGADSINARHTGVAFEYIKNSDAILFVTYYNHAFSKADREFLIQLGRVKDTFSMDKMFFIVNAIDLATNDEEVDEVVSYVAEQLTQYGIRLPHVYPVSSMLALDEKLKSSQKQSRLIIFENQFYSFIEQDLTTIALKSAVSEIQRAGDLLKAFIHNAKMDKEEKASNLLLLQEEQVKINQVLAQETKELLLQRLYQESNELAYYIKQRVFFRFSDFFKESFNPSLLKDDGRNMKKALQKALEEFLTSIGYDFAQELRATSLRVESFITKLLTEKEKRLTDSIQEVNKELSFSKYEIPPMRSVEFENAFENLDFSLFKKVLSLFKNPKSFFEQNDKKLMMDELESILSLHAKDYVEFGNKRIKQHYQEILIAESEKLIEHMKRESVDYYEGTLAVLSDELSVNLLNEIEAKMAGLITEK